jgi:hypothetical protein
MKTYTVILASIIFLMSCGSLKQENPGQSPESASAIDEFTLPKTSISAQQLFKACIKTIDNPHISTTISTEIVVKGTLQCPASADVIVAVATISLLRKVNDSTYLIQGQKSVQITLSATGATSIPKNKLVAASPCVPGTYRGKIETTYTNLDGITIALSIPLFSPSEVVIKCPLVPPKLAIAVKQNPMTFDTRGQYVWNDVVAQDNLGNTPPVTWSWTTSEQTGTFFSATFGSQNANPNSFASGRMGTYTLTATLQSDPTIKATTQVQVLHPAFPTFTIGVAQLGSWSSGGAQVNPPNAYPIRCYGYADLKISNLIDGSISSSLSNINFGGVAQQDVYKDPYKATWDFVIQSGACGDPNPLIQDQLKSLVNTIYQRWKSQAHSGILYGNPRMVFGMDCLTFWTAFRYDNYGCYVIDLFGYNDPSLAALSRAQLSPEKLAPPRFSPPDDIPFVMPYFGGKSSAR